jgi:hypothetical protein
VDALQNLMATRSYGSCKTDSSGSDDKGATTEFQFHVDFLPFDIRGTSRACLGSLEDESDTNLTHKAGAVSNHALSFDRR